MYIVYGHLTIIDKSLLLNLNQWHYPWITYLNPCLCKSWTQLFLKRPNLYLVGNGSWSQISMLDLRPNKQTSKPGRRKVPNEVPSSIEYWIEEEEEKTRQIEKGSRKKMSETTNWLRLRSHSYLRSKVVHGNFVPFCSYTMKIHTDTDSTS